MGVCVRSWFRAEREETLQSVGLGFRFAVARHLSTSFDYGWGVARPEDVHQDSRAHFSITLSY